MKKFLLISFTLLCSVVYSQTQNVEDVFHFAGNLYINGNNKGAKAEVERGLSMYPSDPKLLALKEKIKEEEQKQQEQEKQQQDKEQDQKDQDQQKEGEEEKQNKDQQEQDKQEQQGQDQENDQEEKQEGEPQEVPVGEISKEDAERLLKALEEEEKAVLEKLEKEKAKGRKVPAEKEW